MVRIQARSVYAVILFASIYYCLHGVQSQNNDGQRCFLSNRNIGICKQLYTCPEIVREAQPQRCGYQDYTPIVCCPVSYSDNLNYGPGPGSWPSVAATAPPRKPTPPPRRPTVSESRPIAAAVSYPGKHFKKCQEYSRELRKVVVEAIPLVLDPNPIRFEISRCYTEGLPLIVGGDNTTQGEFPHMAALGYRSNTGGVEWACGGSLISENIVLTAAHCIHTRFGPPRYVRLGELNLNSDNDGAHPVDFTVSKYFVHPNYNQQSHYNDVALVKLSRNVPFSSEIHPACLYHEKTVPRNMATATGWGRVGYGDDTSDTLLKVNLNIIPNDECNDYYTNLRSPKLRNGVIPTQLCAGHRAGGKDTCQGDSGGPLQVEMRGVKCMFGIVGLTSFGPSACGFATPGVYTKVSAYLDWIESIAWP